MTPLIPAELTSTSIEPNFIAASRAAAAIPSWSVTSTTVVCAAPTWPAAVLRASALMSQRMTFAPDSTKRRAMAIPRPPEPPVTMAMRSCRSSLFIVSETKKGKKNSLDESSRNLWEDCNDDHTDDQHKEKRPDLSHRQSRVDATDGAR